MNKYPQVYYDLQNDHFCRGRDRDRRDNYDRRDRDRRDGDMDRDGKVMIIFLKPSIFILMQSINMILMYGDFAN